MRYLFHAALCQFFSLEIPTLLILLIKPYHTVFFNYFFDIIKLYNSYCYNSVITKEETMSTIPHHFDNTSSFIQLNETKKISESAGGNIKSASMDIQSPEGKTITVSISLRGDVSPEHIDTQLQLAVNKAIAISQVMKISENNTIKNINVNKGNITIIDQNNNKKTFFNIEHIINSKVKELEEKANKSKDKTDRFNIHNKIDSINKVNQLFHSTQTSPTQQLQTLQSVSETKQSKFETSQPSSTKASLPPSLKSVQTDLEKLKTVNIFVFDNRATQLSEQLATLRLYAKNNPDEMDEVNELQKQLFSVISRSPNQKTLERRLKTDQEVSTKLAKLYQEKNLKGSEKDFKGLSFSEVVSKMCVKYHYTPAEIRRDANTTGCSITETKARAIGRLVDHLEQRKEITGYPLSVITATEKAMKKLSSSHEQGDHISKIKGKFTIMATKGHAIIEERILGKGTFKIATLAADYLLISNPEERGGFVTLKPKPQEATPEKPKIEYTENTDDENEAYGSFVEREELEEDKSFMKLLGQNIVHLETQLQYDFPLAQLSNQNLETLREEIKQKMEGLNESSANPTPEYSQLKQKLEDIEKIQTYRDSANELKKTARTLTDAEEYQHDVDFNQMLTGIPFIMPIHTITKAVDGTSVVVQPAAGYTLMPNLKRTEKITAIDLNSLNELHWEKKLTAEETAFRDRCILDYGKGILNMHNYVDPVTNTPTPLINRDVKPANCLVTKEGGKVSDFGTACKRDGDPSKVITNGSPGFMAPEVFAWKDDRWCEISTKTDVFSFGVLLFQSYIDPEIEKHPLYANLDSFVPGVTNDIINNPKFRDEFERETYPEPSDPDSIEHLIWQCTQVNPDKRPTMEVVVEKLQNLNRAQEA